MAQFRTGVESGRASLSLQERTLQAGVPPQSSIGPVPPTFAKGRAKQRRSRSSMHSAPGRTEQPATVACGTDFEPTVLETTPAIGN